MLQIVDTTLRDGEQRAGIALGTIDKVNIAKIIDELGVYQIEAGIPAMEGDEKRSVRIISKLGLRAKISAWNRMNVVDIKHSIDCNPDILHISIPSSDIQIYKKLKKDRRWVLERMMQCVDFAMQSGIDVTLGFEDASRADINFLIELIGAVGQLGVKRVRYADTVGMLTRKKIINDISVIKIQTGIEIEMHAHNDLGMAVSNSVAAALSGAQYIDCTIGGIGERAGNCSLLQFTEAAAACLGELSGFDYHKAESINKAVMDIVDSNSLSCSL